MLELIGESRPIYSMSLHFYLHRHILYVSSHGIHPWTTSKWHTFPYIVHYFFFTKASALNMELVCHWDIDKGNLHLLASKVINAT